MGSCCGVFGAVRGIRCIFVERPMKRLAFVRLRCAELRQHLSSGVSWKQLCLGLVVAYTSRILGHRWAPFLP